MTDSIFSIIIPTFNAEKTLDRALNSILAQSFKRFEILIIDGASSDSTVQIIKEYSSSPFISFISESDNGVYDAMNKGIEMAKGQWMYFLGSDDYLYDSDVLESVYNAIENLDSKINFIYGNVKTSLYDRLFDGVFDDKKILKININHQAIFYKKTVFKEIGCYNLKYKIAADYEFNLRCYFNSKIKTKFIGITIAYFDDGGLSSVGFDEAFYKDFPALVKKFTGKELSLKDIKQYCSSYWEFLLVVFKRTFKINSGLMLEKGSRKIQIK